jgi:hypothetical protein
LKNYLSTGENAEKVGATWTGVERKSEAPGSNILKSVPESQLASRSPSHMEVQHRAD